MGSKKRKVKVKRRKVAPKPKPRTLLPMLDTPSKRGGSGGKS